jgi:hypothetical protein
VDVDGVGLRIDFTGKAGGRMRGDEGWAGAGSSSTSSITVIGTRLRLASVTGDLGAAIEVEVDASGVSSMIVMGTRRRSTFFA